MKAATVCLLALPLVLTLSACGPHRPPVPAPPLAPWFDSTDSVLARTQELWDAADYATAAEILRPLGREHYSYYRMEEVLYWLGRVNVRLGEPERAARCFALLRRYYPRCGAHFEDLEAWEAAVATAHVAAGGSAPAGAPEAAARSAAQPLAGEQEATGAAAGGPPVSNVFYETDIRQALMDISAQTGVSIIPDALTHGYVTAEIRELPLEACLARLLTPLGLTFRKMEDYYLVGAPVDESPAYPFFTLTRRIPLSYRSAADLTRLLPTFYSRYVKADGATNTLAITAPLELIAAFEEVVAVLDQPAPQVMIEALVVEMSSDARRAVGLDWDWTGTRKNAGFRISKLLPAMIDSSFIGEILKIGEHHGEMQYDLRGALRLLADRGQAEIRANPRVATQDGREASIQVGREAYYSLVRGNVNYPYVTLEKITTGILLKITPYCGATGEISIMVNAEVSDVTGAGPNDLPVTSVRSAQSTIRVPNGQTFGIGGLVLKRTSRTESGIPILSEIPLIGDLFTQVSKEEEEAEVVILVTPHLLLDPALFDAL